MKRKEKKSRNYLKKKMSKKLDLNLRCTRMENLSSLKCLSTPKMTPKELTAFHCILCVNVKLKKFLSTKWILIVKLY